MSTIAFFNNKGGVGKTTLVFHLAWLWAEAGRRVLIVDLDPQSNLTAMCLDEERLEGLWAAEDSQRRTVYGALDPIVQGTGDVAEAHVEELHPRLALLVGDIRLSSFEGRLSDAWPRSLDRDPAQFRILSAFHRIIRRAAETWQAGIVLIDVGPNLGAINRAALIASRWVVNPLGCDLFSVQGLRNLGPTLAGWRQQWQERLARRPPELPLPGGEIEPVGYVVMQPAISAGRVTASYHRWLDRMPGEYRRAVIQEDSSSGSSSVGEDPWCLGVLKHYRSLMTMAQETRKPIFRLTPADGALGAHYHAARDAGGDFRKLAERIEATIHLPVSA